MNAFAQFTTVAALSLAAAGATWLAKGRPSGIPQQQVAVCDRLLIRDGEICPEDVPVDVLWIDARPRSEWSENGLRGSILWNLDPKEDSQAFEAEAASAIFASGAGMVVVYCGSEACGTSRIIADRIRSLGLGPEVRSLAGGWDALRPGNSD